MKSRTASTRPASARAASPARAEPPPLSDLGQPAPATGGFSGVLGRTTSWVLIWLVGVLTLAAHQFHLLHAGREQLRALQTQAGTQPALGAAIEQAMTQANDHLLQAGLLLAAVVLGSSLLGAWLMRSGSSAAATAPQAARAARPAEASPLASSPHLPAAARPGPVAPTTAARAPTALDTTFMPLTGEPSLDPDPLPWRDALGDALPPVAAPGRDAATVPTFNAAGSTSPATLAHLSSDPAITVPSAFVASQRAPLEHQSVVQQAVDAAQRGGAVVTQVVAHMEEIASSSRTINEVLATIDSIAVQTNILALNAAVQSARARHEGSGGDKVAGEVRLLAQRAASAAREIKALMNASAEKVAFGDRLVRDAGATMDAMVNSVQSVTDLVGQIASGEPGEVALVDVDLSVQRLDDLTRQHQGLVDQSATAAEALRLQADRLQKVVGAFRLLQQTQEAAWQAHTVIHSVRASARAETRPGGLDDLNPKAGGDWTGF